MDKLFLKLIKAGFIIMSAMFIFVATLASAAGSTLDAMNSLTTAPASKTTIPGHAILIPNPPTTSSAGYILMDTDSGKIIAGKSADTRMPPASLTKLMTLYVASNALRSGQIHLTDQVRISKKAWQTGGSRMFVKVNELVTVEDLLKGIIVDSGNDACVALAEYIAGSEDAFASLMNQEAARLGMQNSHFTDCNGLPNPAHYSSPHDLAILARHLINDFPEYYSWYSQKSFTYNGITQSNRNRLLWIYPYADGLKTGHTDDAGFCLVASAKKNGMRLISVTMDAPSDTARADDNVSLMTYGFNFFKTYKLYSASETIVSPRVWKGRIAQLPVGIAQNVYITLPLGQYKNLKADSVLDTPLMAPLTKGMKVGQLNLMVGDKIIMSLPLVALEDDPKGSYWSQITDSAMMSIQKMFHKETAKVKLEEKQLS